jgi:glucuronide carrier protein
MTVPQGDGHRSVDESSTRRSVMPENSPTTSAVKPVVTMFEQYGAGASYVGHKVAEALGLPFHAQAFSSEQIEATEAAATEENATLSQVFSVMGGAYGGFDGRDVATTQRHKYELVMENNRTVHQFADDGGVIVGRNATVILAQRPSTLHVLLTGDVEDRVKRAAGEAGNSAERATQRQKREDEVRAEMSIILYGWDPRLPDRYDLVFNTSRIDLDRVVEAILAAVRIGTD